MSAIPFTVGNTIPFGSNRATGLVIGNPYVDNMYGTIDPVGGLLVNTSNGKVGYFDPRFPSVFEEASDSPVIDLAEQGTYQHTFITDYLTGVYAQLYYYRGSIWNDNTLIGAFPRQYRVLSSNLQPIAKTGAKIMQVSIVIRSYVVCSL